MNIAEVMIYLKLKQDFILEVLWIWSFLILPIVILICNIKNCATSYVKGLHILLSTYLLMNSHTVRHQCFFLTRMVSLGLEHCAFWSRGKFVFWWPISWRNYNLSWESAYEFLTSIVSHLRPTYVCHYGWHQTTQNWFDLQGKLVERRRGMAFTSWRQNFKGNRAFDSHPT